MVKAEINRFIGESLSGSRKHFYRLSIVGDRSDPSAADVRFETSAAARLAAATRLRSFSHAATIVEAWPDGKVYRVTVGGKPERIRGEKAVKEVQTMICTGCHERKGWSECNGYGECRDCASARVAKQRAASGLASDYGEEADKALDLAVSSFPATFGLRRYPGIFSINRAACFVSEGSIQLVVQALQLDGSWSDLSRGTIAELQKQIVRVKESK